MAEIPSPAKGKISKIHYSTEQACLVGKALCEIEIDEVSASATIHAESKKENLSELGFEDILKAEEDKKGEILEFNNHKSNSLK